MMQTINATFREKMSFKERMKLIISLELSASR